MGSGTAKKTLLVDDEEDTSNSEIAVNKEYASRFEHNMERARWDRLKSTNPRLAAKIEAKTSKDALEAGDPEESESSSDDEDEDDGDAALHDNQTFLSVLSKIKCRDQALYDGSTKLFPDEPSDEEGSDKDAPAAKERPALLKDVLARQALMGEESTSDEEDTRIEPRGPTYVEEQEHFRRSFLEEASKALAAEGDGDKEFGGVLKKQKRRSDVAEVLGTSGDPKEAPEKTQELLDAYFGKDDQLEEDERFLKHYMLNKGWIDKEDEQLDDGDIGEDAEYLEQAERFEARYNHRFEEPGAGSMITYPRNLEGVVRKKDDRRRTAREARAERKAAEATALEEEVKRRKAEKRRELDQRLDRIKDASGGTVTNKMLLKMLGKQDFDMEEYDRAMAAAFDDSYYEAEDEELAVAADEGGSDAADDPALADLPEIDRDEDEEEAARGLPALEEERAELTQMVEEYEKLDAEDVVGGVPTRFRYREVPAASYGLNILEVLRAPEKDLNQVVGMKKLAPYREDGGLVRPNYAKLRQMQEESEAAAQRKQLRIEKAKSSVKLKAELPQSGGQAPAAASAGGKQAIAATEPAQQPKKKRKAAVEEASAHAKLHKAGKKARVGQARQVAPDAGRTESKKQQRQSESIPADDALDSEELLPGAQKDEQAAAAKQQSRLASFSKPTLAKPDKGKANKRKEAQQPAPATPEGVQLTKAQRKNLWRQKRRAMLKQGE